MFRVLVLVSQRILPHNPLKLDISIGTTGGVSGGTHSLNILLCDNQIRFQEKLHITNNYKENIYK